VASQLQNPPLAAEPTANSVIVAALAFAGGAALAYSYPLHSRVLFLLDLPNCLGVV
jgi:hypothetical protein